MRLKYKLCFRTDSGACSRDCLITYDLSLSVIQFCHSYNSSLLRGLTAENNQDKHARQSSHTSVVMAAVSIVPTVGPAGTRGSVIATVMPAGTLNKRLAVPLVYLKQMN